MSNKSPLVDLQLFHIYFAVGPIAELIPLPNWMIINLDNVTIGNNSDRISNITRNIIYTKDSETDDIFKNLPPSIDLALFLRVSVVEEAPEDVVTEVVEAPLAPAVGGSMLFLVVGEIIFIILLDMDHCCNLVMGKHKANRRCSRVKIRQRYQKRSMAPKRKKNSTRFDWVIIVGTCQTKSNGKYSRQIYQRRKERQQKYI